MAILLYFLKVIIVSGIMYAYYYMVLRNKVFHAYNRYYLLATLFLSLVLPCISISVESNNQTVLQYYGYNTNYYNSSINVVATNTINYMQVAYLIYTLVAAVFLVILFKSYYKIVDLKKQYTATESNGIKLYFTNNKATPFSFFKHIFWNNHIDINSYQGKQILNHELVHVQQHHSIDKLCINAVLAVFWYNPIFWIIRRELAIIHEFIADNQSVKQGDAAALAQIILQSAGYYQPIPIANSFFYSPIKRRITMIKQQLNNPRMGYATRVLALPLAVILFTAVCLKAQQASKSKSTTTPKEVVKFTPPKIVTDVPPPPPAVKKVFKFTPPKVVKDTMPVIEVTSFTPPTVVDITPVSKKDTILLLKLKDSFQKDQALGSISIDDKGKTFYTNDNGSKKEIKKIFVNGKRADEKSIDTINIKEIKHFSVVYPSKDSIIVSGYKSQKKAEKTNNEGN